MPPAISPDLQLAGMGAIPHEQGVAFRVWAPNADSVFVVGDFNKWANDATLMQPDETGNWYADVSDARIGHEYKYRSGEVAIGPYSVLIYSQDKRESD